ncbi:MAG: SDR family oxidoreductase [Chloroflexi bacterium]|nr:SDR family oxidoreductase [Chloroflexota bacterium]
MDLGLQGKTALVAAASQGMGRAVALGLAREGARVAICARGREALEATAEDIRRETGAEVFAQVADVSRADDIARLVHAARDRFGAVDILVCNAGGPPPGDFLDFDDEAWRAAFELNLESAIRLCRAVIPDMKVRGWGRIITITSMSVKQPIPGLILSNVMRAGVNGLTKTLADELAPYGITVNNVLPGMILTQRITSLAERRAAAEGIPVEDALERMAQEIPMKRIGTPEEFANVVVFLASERASYVTGTAIQVDGGRIRSAW